MKRFIETIAIALALVLCAAPAQAKGKASGKAASGSKIPAGAKLNACGCYRDESSGTCYCTKKNKCVCPGDCEPQGCEEKHQQDMEREIAAETKKQEEADKKLKARLDEKGEKSEKAEKAEKTQGAGKSEAKSAK